jgi:predicted ester cyclase
LAVGTATRASFPDVVVTLDYMVAVGDLVAYQYTWRSTYLSEWREIAPTGKRLEWRATWFRRVVMASWVGCGLWAVGCGLWAVGCGLWAVGCEPPT